MESAAWARGIAENLWGVLDALRRHMGMTTPPYYLITIIKQTLPKCKFWRGLFKKCLIMD